MFPLKLICSTSNASICNYFKELCLITFFLPKYLLGSSKRSYKRTVEETNTGTVNTSHSNSKYQSEYQQQHLYCKFVICFLTETKNRLKKNNIPTKSVLRTTKEVNSSIQIFSNPVEGRSQVSLVMQSIVSQWVYLIKLVWSLSF